MLLRGVSAPSWVLWGGMGAQEPLLAACTAPWSSHSHPEEECLLPAPRPPSWVIVSVKRQEPKSRRPGALRSGVSTAWPATCLSLRPAPRLCREGRASACALRPLQSPVWMRGVPPLLFVLAASPRAGEMKQLGLLLDGRFPHPPSLKAADTVGLNAKSRQNHNTWFQASGRAASKLSLVSKTQLNMKSQINPNRNPGKALAG